MAWLKVETHTPDKPEIHAIADALQITPEEVFGRCFRLWTWFDTHTENGNAKHVTYSLLDYVTGVTGFANSLVSVGWLIENEAGFSLPNFDKHNGNTAKNRAETAKRVTKFRNAKNVTKALPEKIREDKKVNLKTASATPPVFSPLETLKTLGVKDSIASDWLELRKGKKAKTTQTAIDQVISEAKKAGLSLNTALSECCSRGWAGFKASWMEQKGSAPSIVAPLKTNPCAHCGEAGVKRVGQTWYCADHNQNSHREAA